MNRELQAPGLPLVPLGDRAWGLGLACCAVEAVAAGVALARGAAEVGPGAQDPGAGGSAEAPAVLVVAGTVTHAMAPTVARAYAELAETQGDVALVAYGACASSGGPYWDSYAVRPGLADLPGVPPVTAYVPGCPPRPDQVAEALRDIRSARLGAGAGR